MITEYQVIFQINTLERGWLEYAREQVKADSDANAIAQIRTMIADVEQSEEKEFMARVEIWGTPYREFEVWPANHPRAIIRAATAEAKEIAAADSDYAANLLAMLANVDMAIAEEKAAAAADAKMHTADAEENAADADAEQADFDDSDNPEANANPFKVWGYGDNRAESDIAKGGNPIPTVNIFRGTDNPWHPESVSMSPRQARKIAAAILQAADSAEGGHERFEIEIS